MACHAARARGIGPDSIGSARLRVMVVRSRILRLLLLVLLALAVPMQGAVAASMLTCADARMPAHAHAQPAMAMHDHAGMHHMQAQPDHIRADAKASKPAAASCAICAACSVGHGIVVSAAAFVPALIALKTAPRLPAESFDSYIPEGPERPPTSA